MVAARKSADIGMKRGRTLANLPQDQQLDVIAEGQAKGAFRKQINPTLAAKVLFGALDEMATNWILSRRKYSLPAESDAVVDLFVGGLGK